MRAGDLRHRLEIQTATETLDTFGEPITTWATTVTRWGSVNPVIGRERFQANQITPETTHTIKLRYYALSAKQRIKWGTRIFNIENLYHTEEIKRDTIVMAKEDS
jgi:SPP1 family predicted phage head-tail adaptor